MEIKNMRETQYDVIILLRYLNLNFYNIYFNSYFLFIF